MFSFFLFSCFLSFFFFFFWGGEEKKYIYFILLTRIYFVLSIVVYFQHALSNCNLDSVKSKLDINVNYINTFMHT